jgi:outer membrane protein TolC
VQEIQRSYQQGRVDISQLIDALNRFFAAEIQYTQAVGDYQMSLNEWAAFQDQLITPSDSLPGGSYEN